MGQLLSMNLTASLLILVILLLRHFCGRILSRRCFVWLSMIVILRLLLPLQFDVFPSQIPTVTGIMKMYSEKESDQVSTASEHSWAANSSQNTGKTIAKGLDGNSVTGTMPSLETFSKQLAAFFSFKTPGLFLFWIGGILFTAAVFSHRLWKEYRILRQALPLDTRIVTWNGRSFSLPLFYSDQITSPVTFGFFHCSIVLPKSMRSEDTSGLDLILLHEAMHIQHRDNLRKIFALFCVCIHWFSPLVWIWMTVFFRDLELSCDEAVLSFLGSQNRESYALTLITFMEQNQTPSIMNSGFGQTAVKERIVSIMNYRKKGFLSITLSAVLLCSSITVFAGNSTTDITAKKDSTEAQTESSSDSDIAYEMGELEISEHYSSADELMHSPYYPEYEKLGLTYDKTSDSLMYQGKSVVFLEDFINETNVLLYEDKNYFTFDGETVTSDVFISNIYDSDKYDKEDTPDDESEQTHETETEILTENATPLEDDSVVFLFTLRDENGKLTELQIPEVSYGDSVTEENSSTDEPDEATTEDDLASATVIGGADGPTSIFLAGKLGS